MKNPDIFIIFRRAWKEDDLEYGSFEPIFISTKEYEARRRFREIRALGKSLEGGCFTEKDDFFEYNKNKWFYQYKISGFVMDSLLTVANLVN